VSIALYVCVAPPAPWLTRTFSNRPVNVVPPEHRVLAYLRDRRRWELASQRRYAEGRQSGTLNEALDAIAASYRQLLVTHCGTLKESLQNPVFGDPPSVDPTTTRITSVERKSPGRVIVKTTEDAGGPAPEEYEYELVLVDDQWLLRDRRARDFGGRWVRGLL